MAERPAQGPGEREGVRVNVSSPAMVRTVVNVVNVPSLGPGRPSHLG